MTNKWHEQMADEYFREVIMAKPLTKEELQPHINKMVAEMTIPKSALRKYNEIMEYVCLEHNTIGMELSEGTEKWNLRDMVAECDYTLSTYFEEGHANCEMKRENRKAWLAETGRLKRFIAHWAPFIGDLKCAERHCSKYDN